MRAPFNNTGDFIWGPGTASPGVVRFTASVRYVPEVREIALTVPLNQRTAYITVDDGLPFGPGVTGGPDNYTVDYLRSDLVAIPSGNVPAYQVVFTELVTPFASPVYFRAHCRYYPELQVLAQEDSGLLLQEDGQFLLVS